MDKVTLAFVSSHLKKAIYNLECANKLKTETVNEKLISDLKAILENLVFEKEKK